MLEEGARSYFEAHTVIADYEREVQKKCREVLKKHLVAYQAALDIKLRDEDIKDYAYHDSDSADLGVKIARPAETPGVSWWESYCALHWNYTDPRFPHIVLWVGMALPTKKMAAALHTKMQFAGTERDRWTVYLEQELEVHEAADFEEKLEELLCKWIDAWKQLDGFKGFLSTIQTQALSKE